VGQTHSQKAEARQELARALHGLPFRGRAPSISTHSSTGLLVMSAMARKYVLPRWRQRAAPGTAAAARSIAR
jgi:hypothetical protein